MKKLHLFKTMLLLCALIVGSSSVWADEIESNFTDYNCAVGTGELQWTATNTSSFETSGSARGVQSNKNTTAMVFTSNTKQTEALGTITRVVVKASANAARSITVTVGGESFGSTLDVEKGTANSDFTFEGSASGTIVVSFNGGTSKSTCWIKKITVTYSASVDPSSAATFADTTPSINFPATTTYSQVATTATGYTGVVTYEITANTAGATIDGSTVTVTQEGRVTVKATAPAITGWSKSEATYTLTVNDPRKDTGLEYDEDSQEVTVGEILDAPTLTNPNRLAVTYESDNEEIATVDEDGNVTGVAVGSTTITARFAGDATYKSGSASYTITVKKATVPAKDGVFDFTFADEIDYGTRLTPSTNDIKEAKTFTAGNVTLTPEPTATNKYWRWYDTAPYTLRLYTDTRMTIAVPDGYVITKIDFVGTQNLNAVTWSSGEYEAAEDKKSATWTGKAQSVVFTRNGSNPFYTKVTVTYAQTSTINLNAACNDGEGNIYGTYSNSKSFVVPADLTVSAVKVVDGKLVVTNYSKDDIVPANTGVMVSSTVAGNHTILLSDEAGEEIDGNMLKASSVAMTGENLLFYRLTMHNGKQIGFWWGAEDGAAFYIAANKAYLAVPKGETLARGLWFDEGETTAISEVRGLKSDVRGEYFNLNGQRVAQPTKGLYIVNGRKVVIK